MARYGLKEVADVTFYDMSSGLPIMMFDSLKMSNLEAASETTYATGGKGNPKIIGWDFGRTVTLTLQDALISFETLGMLAGTASNTTSSTPYRTASFINASVSPTTLVGTQVARNVLTNAISNATTNSSLSSGDWIVVSNAATVTGTAMVTFDSSKYPGYYKVVGTTLIRNESTGTDEIFQFVINKAKLQPGFTFTMQAEGDPSTFDLNIDVFKDSNSDMIKLIQFTD